ncbi:MAG TPA: polyprenyl synthetase family protein [Desulfuromonadales bacterium]|nr:polyprenyl synthetase family protein [Desulfuromonadales bacterium]
MDMDRVLNLLKDDICRVEAQFRLDLDSRVPLIRKVGEYVLASGGKRIRPMLLLLCARLTGYRGEAHIGLASVVEFIHTATLLHDDVVDSAVLRRGQESANAVWGNEASVLVGDFLFAKSFSIMVRNGSLDILRALSDATTQMAEGEVLQLISTCDLALDEERYIEVVRNKTAVLLAAACRSGAILGEAAADQQEALAAYGMDLGIAFQFMDDALDYVAEQEEFGKARGHDLLEGKVTLPLIHALRQCSAEERSRVENIVEQEELPQEDLGYVIELIDKYDGIQFTRLRAATFVEQAKTRLAVFEADPIKEALEILADYVVSRSS